MNFEIRRREVERVDEPQLSPSRNVFVSIVGREIEEKVEKYIVLLFHYHLYKIIIYPQQKWISKNAGGRSTAWMNPKYSRIGTSSLPF